MGDKERNIQKLSSISPKLSQGCSQQEPWARIWIFSPLSIHSFYLNTVALWVYVSFFLGALCPCSFRMVHFSLAYSRDWENRLSEKWDNCSTESAGWRQAGLQPRPGLGELESGNVSEVSWSSQEPGTYRQILVCMCLTNYGFESIASCMTIYRKPNICTIPPFPPISYETFFIL